MKIPSGLKKETTETNLWHVFDNKMKTSRVFAVLYWFWMMPVCIILCAILAQFSLNLFTVIIGIWLALGIIIAVCYGFGRMVDNFDF